MSARKKRPLLRDETVHRDCRLIVIATEDSKTEPAYFELFHHSRVKIHVIPSLDGRSSPKDVLKAAIEFAEQYDLDEEDKLWLVMDIDRWKLKDLSEVSTLAAQKNFRLALSNPCFEVWIYLHFNDLQSSHMTCKEFKTAIKSLLGSYSQSTFNKDFFDESNIQMAIERAESLNVNPTDRWPNQVGTHVYKLINEILQLRVK